MWVRAIAGVSAAAHLVALFLPAFETAKAGRIALVCVPAAIATLDPGYVSAPTLLLAAFLIVATLIILAAACLLVVMLLDSSYRRTARVFVALTTAITTLLLFFSHFSTSPTPISPAAVSLLLAVCCGWIATVFLNKNAGQHGFSGRTP